MAGKVNNYGLGEGGVNTSVSPIHLDDKELLKAQNAIYDPKGGEGGLRKRDGMSKVNSVAAGSGGAIKGLVSIPLPDPSTVAKTLWLGYATADANTWTSSTDGTTFTPGTTLGDPVGVAKLPTGNYFFQRALSFYRKLYYPYNTYTQGSAPPTLRCYDGTTDLDVLSIPNSQRSNTYAYTIMDLCTHNGSIALAIYDTGGSAPDHRGRVLLYNPFLGTLEQVGEAMGATADGELQGGMPWSLVSYGGLLWYGSYGVSGSAVGRIYRIRSGVDTTWTQDHATTAGQGYITGMAGYLGRLFACTTGDAGSAALVKVRSTAGVWTTSATSGTTTGGHYYCAPIVFEGNLYAGYSDTGAGNSCLIRIYNNSAWSTSLDVGATYANQHLGASFIWKGDLYWVVCSTGAAMGNADGFLLKKAASGGAWSRPLNAVNLRSYIGQVVTMT